MGDVSRSELEEVVRRAVELQLADEDAGGDAGDLTAEEVVRIGREVGLEPRFVERAIAEVRAASLRPDPPAEDSWTQRLLGPGFVRASRFLQASADRVTTIVERELQEGERLRRVDRAGGRSTWAPAQGWRSRARTTDEASGGHAYDLATVRSLAVDVRAAGDGRALVTLTADVRNQRTSQLVTWISGLGLSGAVAGGFLAVLGGAWAVLAPVPPLALAAVGVRVSVPGFREDREHVERAVERFFDRLEGAVSSELEDGGERRRVPPFF